VWVSGSCMSSMRCPWLRHQERTGQGAAGARLTAGLLSSRIPLPFFGLDDMLEVFRASDVWTAGA
jgi:hypothetical protein